MSREPAAILHVEDDLIEVMGLRRALSRRGLDIEVRHVTDGLEALEVLRSNPSMPFLVLLDLNLPRMSGLEFLAALRHEPEIADTPVLVVTTSLDDFDRDTAEAYGIRAYFSKDDMAGQLDHILPHLDVLNA